MPIFKSRQPAAKSVNATSAAKSALERQIDKEVTVLSIAMPFLPRDQVRGLVLKKLGLDTGSKGKTLVRTGGARIDYKKLNVTVPKSPKEKAEGMDAPKNIRKKLLGHSECIQIEGRRPRPADGGREEAATDDSFSFFGDHTPVESVPKIQHKVPPKKVEEKRKKKTPKKRLFSCNAEVDVDVDEIIDAFDSLTSGQPVALPENYVKITTRRPPSRVPQRNLWPLPRRHPPQMQEAAGPSRRTAVNEKVSMQVLPPPPREGPPPMQQNPKQRRRTSQDFADADEELAMEVLSPPRKRKSPPPSQQVPGQSRRTSDDIAATDGGMPMDARSPPSQEVPQQRRRTSDEFAVAIGEVPKDVLSPPRESPPLSQVSPPLSQVSPPLSQVSPPLSQESPPLSQESPSLSQESAPLAQVTPPLSQETPPLSQDSPPLSQEVPEHRRRTSDEFADAIEEVPMELLYPPRESTPPSQEVPEQRGRTIGEESMEVPSPPVKSPPPSQEVPQHRRRTSEDIADTIEEASMEVLTPPGKSPPPSQEVPEQRGHTIGEVSMEVLSPPPKSPSASQEVPQHHRRTSEGIAATHVEEPMEVLSSPRRSPSPMQEIPETPEWSPLLVEEELSPIYKTNGDSYPPHQNPVGVRRSSPKTSTPTRSSKSAVTAASGQPTVDPDDIFSKPSQSSPLLAPEASSPIYRTNSDLYRPAQTPLRPYRNSVSGLSNSQNISSCASSSEKSAIAATSEQPTLDPNDIFSEKSQCSAPQAKASQTRQTISGLRPRPPNPLRPSEQPVTQESCSAKQSIPPENASPSQSSPLLAQEASSPIYHTNSELYRPAQTPLRPYRNSVSALSNSQNISSCTSSSEKSAIAATSEQPTLDPNDIFSEKSQCSAPQATASQTRQTISGLRPRPPTPLRPSQQPMTQESCSAKLSIPAENASPEQDKENEPVDMDQCTDSPVEAEQSDVASPATSSSLESASQISSRLARQQHRPAGIITTPRTSHPYRGQSTKKGQPWIEQVPVGKMTARRALFAGHVPLASPPEQSSNPHGNEFADQEGGNGEMIVEDEDELMLTDEVEIDSEVEVVSLTRRLNRTAIPTTPLLLKKGADRIDGLPFSSGEAVRPGAAEWLHLRKSQSQSQGSPAPATPKTPSVSAASPANQRQVRAVVSFEACEVRTTDQADLPTETARTCVVLQSSEELCSQFSSSQTSKQSANWWQEESVLNALTSLGADEPLDSDSLLYGSTQPVSQTTEQNISTQVSSVQGSMPRLRSSQILKNSQQSGNSSIPSPFGKESTTPTQGSTVNRFVPFIRPSRVPKTSQQSGNSSIPSPFGKESTTPIQGSTVNRFVPFIRPSRVPETSQQSGKSSLQSSLEEESTTTTQGSSVNRFVPSLRSSRVPKTSQQSGKSSLQSSLGEESTTTTQGSSVNRSVPFLRSSGVVQSATQSSKPFQATNALTLSPTQMSESSQHSDLSSVASSAQRSVLSFSFRRK